MRRSPLVPLVVLAILLQACCFLYSAVSFSAISSTQNQPLFLAIGDNFSPWLETFLLFAAGIAYGRSPAARPPLQILAVFGAIYGLVLWTRSSLGNFQSVLHGDLLAVGAWTPVLFVLIGILAVADYMLTRMQRAHRLRGFRQ